MSQITFNIADYRPLSRVRTQPTPGRNTFAMRRSGFLVVTSESDADERQNMSLNPAVVDIRALREPRMQHASEH